MKGRLWLCGLLAAFLTAAGTAGVSAFTVSKDQQANTQFYSPATLNGVSSVEITSDLETLGTLLYFKRFEIADGAYSAPSRWGTRAVRKWEARYNGMTLRAEYQGLQPGCALVVGLGTPFSTEGSAAGFPTFANNFAGKLLLLKFFRGDGVVAVNGRASREDCVYFNVGVSPNITPHSAAQGQVAYHNLLEAAAEFPWQERAELQVSTAIEEDGMAIAVRHGAQDATVPVPRRVLESVYPEVDRGSDARLLTGKLILANYSYQNKEIDRELKLRVSVEDALQVAYEAQNEEAYSLLRSYRKLAAQESAPLGAYAEQLKARDAFLWDQSALRPEDTVILPAALKQLDALIAPRYEAALEIELARLGERVDSFTASGKIERLQYEALREELGGVYVSSILSEESGARLTRLRMELVARLDARVVGEGTVAVPPAQGAQVETVYEERPSSLMALGLGVGIPCAAVVGIAGALVLARLRGRKRP